MLSPHLDEKSLQLFVASETLPLGHDGMTLISTATGVARSTIYRDLAELGKEPAPSGRVRITGEGRKPAVEVQDGLEEALDALVEPAVREDPRASAAVGIEEPTSWFRCVFRSGLLRVPYLCGPAPEATVSHASMQCEEPEGHEPSGPGCAVPSHQRASHSVCGGGIAGDHCGHQEEGTGGEFKNSSLE